MSKTFQFGNGEWAVGKETALAYNDENNNFKPLPFTFDRGSIATVVNSDGLIETVGVDEPRIDFLNNSKGHLLLEPQRTNSLLQSNQFDTTWTTTNATVTSGQTGVGGSTDAWLLNSSAGYLRQTVSLSGASTMSVYAKKGTAQGIRIRIAASVYANCYIDLSDGSEFFPNTGTNLDVTNVGNNWYRISLSIDSTIGNVRFYALDNTGSNTSGTIYIQYAQLEAGSYATSYIPTQGSAVTRSAESCYQDNLLTDIINASYPFTMYAEAKAVFDSTQQFLTFGNRGISNQYFTLVLNSDGTVKLDARANGISEDINSSATAITNGNFFKAAVTMESATSGKISVNGVLDSKTNFTQQAINSNINDLLVGMLRTNTDTGRRVPVKDVKLYNTALTDAELIALTS